MNRVFNAPFIAQNRTSINHIMFDVLIALTPVTVFAVFRFGVDALLRILFTIFICILLEVIAYGFIKQDNEFEQPSFSKNYINRIKKIKLINLISPSITGLIFILLLPSTTPYFLIFFGCLISILIGKMVFGGIGQNIFNPAGLGRVVIGAFFGAAFIYPGVNEFLIGGTPLGPLKDMLTSGTTNGGLNQLFNFHSLFDLFLGNIPGAMGEISKLLILIGGIYLVVRKSADFRLMITAILTFLIFTFFAGLAIVPNRAFEFMLAHLFTGGFLFGAIFMITDPVTAPVSNLGKILFATLFSFLTVVIRMFGSTPEGMVFALLLVNMIAPLFEYFKNIFRVFNYKFLIINGGLIIIAIPLFYFGLGGKF